MPMPNDDFNWRPNDRSATTLLRYQLEAERWISAVNTAQRKAQPRSSSRDLGFIAMLIQGAFAVVLLALLLLLHGIKGMLEWLWDLQEKRKQKKELQDSLAPNEKIWIISGSKGSSGILKSLFYNEYGELWFLWRFFIRAGFIFGCIFIVLNLLSPFVNPEFDPTDKGFLWFFGAVSVYFAFVEMD